MIKPTPNNIVAILETEEVKRASGIILPNQDKKLSTRVVAVGEGVTLAKVGDRILYRVSGAAQLTHEGNDYVIVDGSCVLGIIA